MLELDESYNEAVACKQIEHDQSEYARQQEASKPKEVALEAQNQ